MSSDTQIAFTSAIEISASREQVYAALNLASSSNRYVARGMSVRAIEGDTGIYEMNNPALPDFTFTMIEIVAKAPEHYQLRTEFPGGTPIGILTGDESSYRLTATADGGCHVHVTGLFFTIPLPSEQLENEIALLEISVHDDLARLKALVEDGPEAAENAGLV